MKKKAAIALGIALILVVALGVFSIRRVLKIEDFTWVLSTVQDAKGTVIACGTEDLPQYPGAEELSLFCDAQGGSLSLTSDSEETTGTYRQTQLSPEGRIYQVELKELGTGYAVCAYTKFDTGERRPTLVVTFPKDKTFTFTGKQKG